MWYRFSAKQKYSGAMVALVMPSDAKKKINVKEKDVPKGKLEPRSNYHITLAYIPNCNQLDHLKDNIVDFLKNFTETHKPMKGFMSGIGVFNNVEDDGSKALYASADIPEIPDFRQELVEGLNIITNNAVSDSHGFTPHMTLAYLDKDSDIPNINLPYINTTFNEIVLAWAGDWQHFKLKGK